LLALATQQ